MKFYLRDPDAAFSGMAGLTLEQQGLYNLIIDRLYSLDGLLLDDDAEVAHMLHLDPRRYKRLKWELMVKKKIRVTVDGRLTANGVDGRLLLAKVRSKSARHAANIRWTNERKSNENNDGTMRGRIALESRYRIESSTNVEAQCAEPPQEVAEKRHPLAPSPQLEAIMKRRNG